MNKALVHFFLFVLFPAPSFGQIHPDIKPYHDTFVAEGKFRGAVWKRPAPQTIQFFTNGEAGIQAGCFWEERAIYISKKFWDGASDKDREIIMFHELAHWYMYSGHIRHVPDDIMNPNAKFTDAEYAEHRSLYIDLMFRRLVESSIDRTDMTLRAGDIIIFSDFAESPDFQIHTMENTKASFDRFKSIDANYVMYDFINSKGLRCRPYEYRGIEPVRKYAAEISQIWGERDNMYMYAPDRSKAPKLGINATGLWTSDTQMELVIDYKTTTVPVRRNATIIYYIKKRPLAAEGKKRLGI
jgi:hypothetical protein